MLKIQCMDEQKFIEYLTKLKGVIPTNTAVISINDPKDRQIISDKNKLNVISTIFRDDLYGYDLLPLNEGIRIFEFIKTYVKVMMENNTESWLIIHSKAGISRAGAIAAFAAEYLTPYKLIDFEYYLSKNLLIQPHKIILEKLFTVQRLIEYFNDDYKNLPYLAYKILSDSSQSDELKNNCNNFLIDLYKLELEELRNNNIKLRMKV